MRIKLTERSNVARAKSRTRKAKRVRGVRRLEHLDHGAGKPAVRDVALYPAPHIESEPVRVLDGARLELRCDLPYQ